MARTPGAIALGDVAAKTSHIDMVCTRCERKGRYETTRLVRKFGVDFPMTELSNRMSTCRRRHEMVTRDRCDILFPGLGTMMYGDVATPPADNDE